LAGEKLNQKFKNVLKFFLKSIGVGITDFESLERMRSNSAAVDYFELLLHLPKDHALKALKLINSAKSGFGQDFFVLSQLDFMEQGYFVEFGACAGVLGSNTYLLEKQFGWNGILAEPAKCWHKSLLRSGRAAHIEKSCVWSKSGAMLEFREAKLGAISTIAEFINSDMHGLKRLNGSVYKVPSISLCDLLLKYNAPKVIDYLSIDTEGSEYEILSNFDFDRYKFNVITCEHNYSPAREKIYDLLISKGYKRVWPELSKFDDWYVSV